MSSCCSCLSFLGSRGSSGGKGKGKPETELKTVQPGGFDNATFITDNKGKKLTQCYDIDDSKKALGEGSFGVVRKAWKKGEKNKKDARIYAVKAVSKGPLSEAKLWREIDIMKILDHPNIIKLYDVFAETKQLHLVMEMCSGGELFDRIIAAQRFGENDAAALMEQILKGMFYMHTSKITHRDLKPENFIFGDDTKQLSESRLKIIDFGLSCKFRDGQVLTTKAGTPYYVAPQVLSGAYNHMADMWSLGVILYVLLCGYPPFYGDTDQEIMNKVRRGNVSFPPEDWQNVSSDAQSLIKKLIEKNEKTRCSAERALNDTWVKDKAPKAKAVTLGRKMVDELRGFRMHNKLKKAAIQLIASRLDDSAIKKLRETFTALDKDHDGRLTKDELIQGLEATGIQEIPQAMTDIMNGIDSDGSGEIDYSEFLAASLDKRHYTLDSAVREAFNFFDKNNDGKISRDELREVFKDDDLKTAVGGASNLEKLLQEVDKNGDGEIDFEEFMQMMHK